MSDFQIKSGDRLPAISTILKRSNGQPVDLTTATSVHFVMRDLTASAPMVDQPATVVGSPTLGQVTYFWADGDTAVPGIYDGSWVVHFADGERQTLPTDDYLEIEVQLDLSSPLGLTPVRPTDGIRPPVRAVGALLATRGVDRTGVQFGVNTKPSYTQVQSIIDSVAGDVDGELNGVAVTPALARLARWCITLGAAATVELTFFPEQASSGGDTSGIWWSRYQASLLRFRTLLEQEGGGPAEFVSIGLQSHTVAALVEYADLLSIAGLPAWAWASPPMAWA